MIGGGFGPAALAEDADPVSSAAILSDLSANIFSALLIVLILLLQIKAAADTSPGPARPVEASRTLPVRPHQPLRASEAVAMLRARDPDAAGPAFDLVEAGLRPAGGTAIASGNDLGAALGGAPASGPVRLYVFSARWFAQATDILSAAGRPWFDISVPRALRSSTDADAWSPGFLDLLSRHGDEATFRTGLARLLTSAPDRLVRDGRVATGSGAAVWSSRPAPSRPALPTLSTLFGLLALAGGGGIVFGIEMRARRAVSLARRTPQEV